MKNISRKIIIILVILFLAGIAQAGAPNFSAWSPIDATVTDLGDASRKFNVTVNQTVSLYWQVDSAYKRNTTNDIADSYTNSTAGGGDIYNVTVTAVSSYGTSIHTWTWNKTAAPAATLVSPTAAVYNMSANITQNFTITVDRSADTTWKLDGTQVQFNSSSTTPYYNTTTTTGTHTVTAAVNNSNGTGNTITWTWYIPTSTMSSQALKLNTTTLNRTGLSTNGTYNFTWTDTGNISRINFTFPTSFNFSGLEAGNVSTNLGNSVTLVLNETTGSVSMYNYSGRNSSIGQLYVNFTSRLRSPSFSTDGTITVTTNKNPTGVTFPIYVRDISKPYYQDINNSVFTVSSESFGTDSTTVTLTGKGAANLTFFAPSITGQTNATHGYGVTNASKIRVYNGTGGLTVFVETDPTVTNPVITLAPSTSGQSANLTAALLGVGGLIAAVTIAYKVTRKKR